MQNTNNLRITALKPLITPALILEELPISQAASKSVLTAREKASDILLKDDPRLLVIVGPCSIHDPSAAIEYAKRLKQEIEKHQDDLLIIMRVYFEKPRTTVGWKGLINDPTLDGRFKINKGLHTARQLLLDINNEGVPTGSEFLDTIIPQYISDLTAWSAIGARTSESQIHRELSSGLSMPVGFKNGTTGSIQIAVDAVCAAKEPHHFLGVSPSGLASIVSTKGNNHCHIILRGSKTGPNYDKDCIAEAEGLLEKSGLNKKIMVDCSHGNSRKDHTKQINVVNDIAEQIKDGNKSICGVMIESNLVAGNQKIDDPKNLTKGQSITDACVDLEETSKMLDILSDAVKSRRQSHGK